MKVYYDFHIHSCLSPCGDNDMTPNNIVNMSALKGLDAIAITDHNCGENAKAAIEAAKELPLTVIPGMEIETSEEIHMVALFPDVSSLL
ncbi:MAG: PHP domain-containing protein, partial [Clostridia bacterium]|nr:PHP domain-containing protein [Clostridia bacterium]